MFTPKNADFPFGLSPWLQSCNSTICLQNILVLKESFKLQLPLNKGSSDSMFGHYFDFAKCSTGISPTGGIWKTIFPSKFETLGAFGANIPDSL